MRRWNRLVLVCALLLLPVMALAQAKLLRHPTYSNGKVAFSYLGDIWMVNEDGSNPQRLTVHTARDVYPRFSPDGKWIAFSSNRYGNYDVFVMPVTGGEPKQLTFYSGGDIVVGWTPCWRAGFARGMWERRWCWARRPRRGRSCWRRWPAGCWGRATPCCCPTRRWAPYTGVCPGWRARWRFR